MEDLSEVAINKSKNYISQKKFKEIVQQIQEEIKLNEIVLEKVGQIDFKHCKRKIDISNFYNIIETYKEQIQETKAKEVILALYYGDPYITLNICMKAIKDNTKLIISINDMMLGTNKALIAIINNVLKENNVKNQISFYNLLNMEEIVKVQEKLDQIICIGNENTYEFYLKNGVKKLYFYPYNNAKIYCDSLELLDLQHSMHKYAYYNNIEMEEIEAKDINEAINQMNKFKEEFIMILLTNNKRNAEEFREKITSKNIFINQNPFKL